MMTLNTGDRFDHYQLEAHIAQGGTGDVYRALDVLTGCRVALKIPMRSVILEAARYEQFLREIEAMRLLQHPFVQRGIESGHYQQTPFLVTEWVEGQSLRHLIQGSAPFSIERAIVLTHRIAEGLAYCHQQGIVHRDIKPENILIRPDDQPVILDFGLALTPERSGTGRPAGTPDYMAPEQIEGGCADQRIDVYALGTMLYEMLAGEVPFPGSDPEVILKRHLYDALPRLDLTHQQVSAQMMTVIARCLQRDLAQRYSSIQMLIHDIDHLESVETGDLDALTAAAPKPSFLKTQLGQVLVLLTATIVSILLLTALAVALKH